MSHTDTTGTSKHEQFRPDRAIQYINKVRFPPVVTLVQ